ncbi:MAG: ABC transporter permease [Clostridiales Family XIII bacterium]|jgi:hypothetical protein|nr:ABC transporter permease [Clostridiales Family XIII bacterium]
MPATRLQPASIRFYNACRRKGDCSFCLVGGIIGIIFGSALGVFAANLLGTQATPSVGTILLATGFSMAIGVFFGYYPANKAAKMDPVGAQANKLPFGVKFLSTVLARGSLVIYFIQGKKEIDQENA